MDREQKAKEAYDAALEYLNKSHFDIAQSRFESLLYFYSDVYPKEEIEPLIRLCKNKTSPEYIIALREKEKEERRRQEEKLRRQEEDEIERQEQNKRKKEEERRLAFANFAKYCDVDCEFLIFKNYTCHYDDMRFTATIVNLDAFSEPIEASDARPCLSLKLNMVYVDKRCVLFPVLHLGQFPVKSIIGEVYIKIGEDRYFTDIKKTAYKITHDLYNGADITLGLGDIEMLEAMVKGNYPVKISLGDTIEYISRGILVDIANYLSDLRTSGVLNQPALSQEKNKFIKFTSLNAL